MTTTFTPPPFIERIQYKNCQQINDPVTRKRVYRTPDGESLPSVTTILAAKKEVQDQIKAKQQELQQLQQQLAQIK